MSLSPAFGPGAPHPVCRPAPVPHRPDESLSERLGHWLNGHLLQPFCSWRARERLYAEMAGMDHRELHDLGLSRQDVADFVTSWQPGRRRSLR
jgi:uncharacterized protein YjiS (DUF1127 family)